MMWKFFLPFLWPFSNTIKKNNNMRNIKPLLIFGMLMTLPLCSYSQLKSNEDSKKPRVIITCDPELDDNNSLIRFLLFSTDYRVEGLIYASSQFHWKGDGHGTKWAVPNREYSRAGMEYSPMESYRWDPNERFIDDQMDAYEKVYPNLVVHNPSYPTPEYLRSKVRVGNVEFDGDFSKDTPGSELIKQVLLDDCPDPVFVNAWGGGSTIARALKSIQDIYEHDSAWQKIREKIYNKVILCMSGDQDDTDAKYIKVFWPNFKRMETSSMNVGLSYGAQSRAAEEDKEYYSSEWMQENIRSKGPFGEMYRVWGDGKQMCKGDRFDFFGISGYTAEELRKQGYVVWTSIQPKGSFLGEGDTYCFLNIIGNGLRGHEDPTFGGWCGGRINLPEDAKKLDRMKQAQYINEHFPLPDFTPAVMNGLAARFKWSVTPQYKDANHEPVIEGEQSLTGKPGETLKLKYKVTDPDKDAVTVSWWPYRSACTYTGEITVDSPSSANTTFTIPVDTKSGDTIHLILEATDNGKPQLCHYHRLIITVKD